MLQSASVSVFDKVIDKTLVSFSQPFLVVAHKRTADAAKEQLKKQKTVAIKRAQQSAESVAQSAP